MASGEAFDQASGHDGARIESLPLAACLTAATMSSPALFLSRSRFKVSGSGLLGWAAVDSNHLLRAGSLMPFSYDPCAKRLRTEERRCHGRTYE